ncbi:MAG: HAMP domain-containing histidine kinase [Planctomycetaceae bacterium]|nr:HAMP domain-containing histidine kinase [Planctomycetaceae bacterium]
MQATSAPATDFAAALEAAKLEALYQFAYGLSHEINNPLANIATRAQTLLVDEKDPERRRKLATINQQAFRAHEMIADLMLFARPPALRKEPTDLAALADRVVSEMQSLAAEHGTTLVRTGVSEPLTATIDPTQIAVALAALVQNSLEALGQGGRVEVGISDFRFQISDCENSSPDAVLSTQYSVPSNPAANHTPIPTPHFVPSPNLKSEIRNLKLSVSDTGPGIPPHTRAHIFDPFFSGREAGRGLGLGLSKAWRIVTNHGGMLTVVSPESGGAVFAIELPGE